MTTLPPWFNGLPQIWDNVTPEPDGYVSIGAQRVGCIELNVPQDGYVMVAVIQASRAQTWQLTHDWTLRCWFSTVQYGISITFQDDIVSSWQATRSKLFQICLYNGTQIGTDPDGAVVYPFRVDPGTYYLNIQNLFNGFNGAYVLLTNSAT
jgi:hypothetical protein